MNKKSYPNVWRFLFLITLFLLVVVILFTKYLEYQTPTVESEYIFQDIIDNKHHYILKNNYNISHYTEGVLSYIYNTSVENTTKNLNAQNAINLYRYVQQNYYLGTTPRRPVEVLERGRGELVGLHSLFSSMLLTLDENNDVYLLLTEYQQTNHSGIIILINQTTHYFDLTINQTNITFVEPIEIMELGDKIGEELKFRYAVGIEEVNYFKRDIDCFFWLESKYNDRGW